MDAPAERYFQSLVDRVSFGEPITHRFHSSQCMNAIFPFLTTYDPPGEAEGSIDPLGLYQIADQLGMQLVPAVRERMQRIRFLTAMAVGAIVTEGLEGDPLQRDASPYIVWEWLIVEALVRSFGNDSKIWGVPGTSVTRRAREQHGYLDARSYLKTPRIFGFNGVYKRLAAHLGLIDVHLAPGPNTEGLVDAWARDQDLGGINNARSMIKQWSTAVRRSLNEKPPRTKPGWSNERWSHLANAFAPMQCKTREKRFLRDLINATDDRRLGALPNIWQLQQDFDDDGYREELLHDRLQEFEPGYTPILTAIRTYETFARGLQDGFDVLNAVAAHTNAQDFVVPRIAEDTDFRVSVEGLNRKFESAYNALGGINIASFSLQNQFNARFNIFSETMDASASALALCAHHEAVQKTKSADGKRPWFDRLGPDRIYVRQAYREERRSIQPGRYVHDYRGRPIRRFYNDLS